MNPICAMFGHRPEFGYSRKEGSGYFRIGHTAVDGMGLRHVSLMCNCERCGARYRVGKLHLPAYGLVPEAEKDKGRS